MIEFIIDENSILNPTLLWGDFEWREPITTLTDQLTALVCLFAYLQFVYYKGKKSNSFEYYKYFFLFFFMGMTSAAWLGHGLQAYLSFGWKTIGWIFSSIGFLLVELGTLKDINNILPQNWIKGLKIFSFIQFITFVTLMISTQNFIFPQLNSTVSLVLFTLPLQLFTYIKTRNKAHLYIVLTILYAVLPGYVYNNKISFHHWLNYHDISHLLMSLYMVFFFISTSKIAFLSTKTEQNKA